VYVEEFTSDDLLFIASTLFPDIEKSVLKKMIEFNQKLHHEAMVKCSFGRNVSPWEFNLRDIIRWCKLVRASITKNPKQFVDMLYLQRFRTSADRSEATKIYEQIFGEELGLEKSLFYHITPSLIQVISTSLPILFSFTHIPI